MVRVPLSASEVERGRRLGSLLRRARADRPLAEVARAAGISPETLRKIEAGRVATPAFQTVASLATVHGMSLDQIWREVGRPGPVGATRAPGTVA